MGSQSATLSVTFSSAQIAPDAGSDLPIVGILTEEQERQTTRIYQKMTGPNQAVMISEKFHLLSFTLHPLKEMVTCNRLFESGFGEWLFYPGMLFDAPEKWWGKGGQRPSPHEGVDICLYRNKAGQEVRLDGTTRIPAMHDGEVVKIEGDFLGKSVYMRHDIRNGNGDRLYTIYGHTRPAHTLHPGSVLNKRDVLGRISEVERKTILSHLHITVAWIPESFPLERLNWATLGERREVRLLDPLLSCKPSPA